MTDYGLRITSHETNGKHPDYDKQDDAFWRIIRAEPLNDLSLDPDTRNPGYIEAKATNPLICISIDEPQVRQATE